MGLKLRYICRKGSRDTLYILYPLTPPPPAPPPVAQLSIASKKRFEASANQSEKSLCSCFFCWKSQFLAFLQATTLATRKSSKSQREITIFFRVFVGNHYFLFSCRRQHSKPRNLQITTGVFFVMGNLYFLTLFGRREPLKPRNLQFAAGYHDFLLFWSGHAEKMPMSAE